MTNDMASDGSIGSGHLVREAATRYRRYILGGLALAVVVFLAWHWLAGGRKEAAPPAPLLVQTMTVAPRMVPEIIETSGTIISPQTVEVRSQADGVLESVRIRDGEAVRRGQVLFTIDPRPLRAALAQAEATLAAILGSLPIALGFGAGTEARRPLGIAVVGGLLFSQALTLYLTPAFHIAMARWIERRGARPQPGAARPQSA